MRLICEDLKSLNEMENNEHLLCEFYFHDKVVKIRCHTINYGCNFSSQIWPWSLIARKFSVLIFRGLAACFENKLL